MVDSRSSSEARHGAGRGARFAWALALGLAAACSTVRPEDKEYLAQPAMSFQSGGEEDAHGEHVMQNREGSFGAGAVSGGGCGCN